MVSSKNLCSYPGSGIVRIDFAYTANISTVLSTAFGSVKCATVLWLHNLQPKIAIDFKLYSSVSLNFIYTLVDCNNHCQTAVPHVTQSMTVNWLYIFAV